MIRVKKQLRRLFSQGFYLTLILGAVGYPHVGTASYPFADISPVSNLQTFTGSSSACPVPPLAPPHPLPFVSLPLPQPTFLPGATPCPDLPFSWINGAVPQPQVDNEQSVPPVISSGHAFALPSHDFNPTQGAVSQAGDHELAGSSALPSHPPLFYPSSLPAAFDPSPSSLAQFSTNPPQAWGTASSSIDASYLSSFSHLSPAVYGVHLMEAARDYALGFRQGGINLEKAQALLIQAANLGHHAAQVYLSYFNAPPSEQARAGFEHYKRQNYVLAFLLFRQAAWQGEPHSQCNLGILYANGQGVAQDTQQACQWYLKAAQQGEAMAECNLGFMYMTGQGVMQSYEEAFKWYQRAAAKGAAAAQYNLGLLYAHGQGVAQDTQEALKWFQIACSQATTVSASSSMHYASQEWLTPIYQEAFRLYQGAAAYGDACSQFNLGVLYAQGQGVPQSYEKAFQWFQTAASQGHAAAQFSLGFMYGRGRGIPPSYSHAFHWFQQAAAQGHASALFNLGILYAHGWGVKRNYQEALTCFQRAVALISQNPHALSGKGYPSPEEGHQIYQAALKWFQTAAAYGYVTAQFSLGVMYAQGLGVSQNYEEALKWFYQAARQGDTAAQFNVGLFYLQGWGVRHDEQEAFQWFQRAAFQGQAAAQFNLAIMYAQGQGIPQSYEVALYWLNQAALRGETAAIDLLKKVS